MPWWGHLSSLLVMIMVGAALCWAMEEFKDGYPEEEEKKIGNVHQAALSIGSTRSRLHSGRVHTRSTLPAGAIAPVEPVTDCRMPHIGRGVAAVNMPFQVSLLTSKGPAGKKKFRYPSFACIVVNDELRQNRGGRGRTPSWTVDRRNRVVSRKAMAAFIERQNSSPLPFDRGHLIAQSYFNDPARAAATFRLENMVPQYRLCNSEYWARSVESKVRDYVINHAHRAFDGDTKIIVGTAGVRKALHEKNTRGVVLVKWMWTAVCRTSPAPPEERYPAGSYLVAIKATEKPPHPPDCGDPYPDQRRPGDEWDSLPDPPRDAPELRPIKEWLEANCQGPWHNFQRLVVKAPLALEDEARRQKKKKARNARPQPPDKSKVPAELYDNLLKKYQVRLAKWEKKYG